MTADGAHRAPLQHRALYRGSNDIELRHQFPELRGIERLCSIAKGGLRRVMDLNQKTIRAGCDGSARHRRDFISAAGTMRRIDEYGKVRQLFDNGNR